MITEVCKRVESSSPHRS